MSTLYRKYRSKTFDEIIGQDPIVATLSNQIKLGRVGHAYLFTGSRGTGKTSCARIFARAVNCLNPVNGSPCGECEVCKKLASDNVDIIEMDAASNNGVDDARDIREKVKYLPVACKYKVYIIDEVHMLTGGAFNALLKTLEEPPEHVIFILATTEPHKLPQTILSRCIRFDFKLVDAKTLAAHIKRIYAAEGVKFTDEACDEIARLGEGSVRDSLSIADTLMSAADVITPETVRALTGEGENVMISALYDAIADKNIKSALKCVDELAKSGKSFGAALRRLVEYARGVLVCKSLGNEASSVVSCDGQTFEKMLSSSQKSELNVCADILTSLGSSEAGIKYSVNPRVFLETAVIKIIAGEKQTDELLRRVAALERKLGSGLPDAEQKKNKITQSFTSNTEYPAPPEPTERFAPPAPPEPTERFAPPAPPEPKTVAHFGEQSDDMKSADEGEFMHKKSGNVGGLELIGKIACVLRKKGTFAAARARDLLSRGVVVKERESAVAFVAPEEAFLSMTDGEVMAELNAALKAIGFTKPARIDRTEEDLLADDYSRCVRYFTADCTVLV